MIVCLAIALMVSGMAHSQHPWQQKPERDPAEIERILGPMGEKNPSRDLHIVWVWGIDKNHDRGGHEYGWVMDRYVNTLLPTVPRITVERAMYFPSDEQWAKADLIVFYAQQRAPWGEREYGLMDAFQERGGGLMFFHLAILEGSGFELAKRIGLAYGTTQEGNGPTSWGPLAPVSLTDAGKKSSFFEGFPDTFDLVDEHYWNLAGDASKVTTYLTAPGGPTNASTRAPKPEELDGKPWPVVWTHESGKGRVFATLLGHNYFTFNDPYFRIILLRAMAWTLNESFDPFKPLVISHLER
ncbi:MAG: ThuA domain-containing protein [Candidatus Hydrogenedentes bacterium]|nr:ThuA domain-containing protein [Candidatus Hydrogenedentota bacterium]